MKKFGFPAFFLICFNLALAQTPPASSPVTPLPPFAVHPVSLENGKSLTLSLPEDLDINLAAQGMKCPRFMTQSPDHRLFVAGLYNRGDTKLGRIYLLEDFDPETGTFGKVVTYLDHLHNPNSVAFYSDMTGQSWIYIAQTDRLSRYRYETGSENPSGKEEVLATFPAYGLGYKYGGWHLTRTLCVGGNGKLYISVGSSCNACEEKKDEVRACVLEMDLDGKNQKVFASGLRNAVGLKWVNGRLFATNMGADHLGDDDPDDTFWALEEGRNYGWPYAYVSRGANQPDPKFGTEKAQAAVKGMPDCYSSFPAHSSPLGLEYFGLDFEIPELRDCFLVGLHGSSKKSLGRGYRIVRLRKGLPPEDFIAGFWKDGKVLGRPCDILQAGSGAFFFTDDLDGALYYVRLKKPI
jgi:glucose/arabinose dehydrogenase